MFKITPTTTDNREGARDAIQDSRHVFCLVAAPEKLESRSSSLPNKSSAVYNKSWTHKRDAIRECGPQTTSSTIVCDDSLSFSSSSSSTAFSFFGLF